MCHDLDSNQDSTDQTHQTSVLLTAQPRHFPNQLFYLFLSDSGCMLISDQRGIVTVVPEKDVYLPGDQVQISCPSGYRVSGSIERICRSDLTWSGEATMCIAEGIPTKQKQNIVTQIICVTIKVM